MVLRSFLLLALLAPTAGAQTCPTNVVADRSTTAGSSTWSRDFGVAYETGTYDLKRLSFAETFWSAVDGTADVVDARDDYVLVDPRPGTSVTLQLTLHLLGSFSGTGSVSVHVNSEPYSVVGGIGTPDGERQFTLPIVATSGEPFQVRYRLSGTSRRSGRGWLTMSGHFSGIPADGVLRSCQGYVADAASPIAASWGQVRAHYR